MATDASMRVWADDKLGNTSIYHGTRRTINKRAMCLNMMDALFDDKRIIVIFLICWLTMVLIIFEDLGLMNTQFMALGPSKSTVFMGVTLDSWYKWGLVAAFTFVNTAVNDFMSDAISPWILNTITDHKTRFIPYPKWMCLGITQVWSMYCNIMSVFSIFLAMSQIDFVLIRMIADLLVNAYTTTKFIRNKTFCPEQYKNCSSSDSTEMVSLKADNTSLLPSKASSQEDDENTRHTPV
jgi:hypothetical protein